MARVKNFKLPPNRPAISKDTELFVLRGQVAEQAKVIEALCAQVSEMNLRTRFIMQQFDWKKGAGLQGPDGKPIVLAQGSMFDYYLLTRDQFLDSLLGVPDVPSSMDDAAQGSGATGTNGGRPTVQGDGRTSGQNRPSLVLT